MVIRLYCSDSHDIWSLGLRLWKLQVFRAFSRLPSFNQGGKMQQHAPVGWLGLKMLSLIIRVRSKFCLLKILPVHQFDVKIMFPFILFQNGDKSDEKSHLPKNEFARSAPSWSSISVELLTTKTALKVWKNLKICHYGFRREIGSVLIYCFCL